MSGRSSENPARESLRIGIDARELQGRPTGTGRYVRNLLTHWPGGVDDRLLLFVKGEAPALEIDDPRVEIRALPGESMRGLAWQELRLAPAAGRERLDVFFAPAYWCPLRIELPRVTTVHDLSFRSAPHDFAPIEALRRRLLVAWSVRVSRQILVVSAFSERELLSWHPEARGRIVQIPHGADEVPVPAPSRAAAKRAIGVAGPLVVSVGAIFNRRRLPELLAAISCVRRSRPETTLAVIGENRTQPPIDFQAMLRRLGLENNVRMMGFVSEEQLTTYYAAADVVAYLSDYEGFGLPVLEAMTRGVPVVAGDRPSVSELFGEAAFLVDPASPVAIASALQRVLEDEALRERSIAAGRAVAGRFSWGRAAEATRTALARAAG